MVLLTTSCERNNLDPAATLIFGEAYGFCAGDCAHFFQISNKHIYKDNIDRFGTDLPTFDDIPLSGSDYELAESLLANFPSYLLDNPNVTLGCPDCADQGGIHIYYIQGTNTYFWHIDTFIDNQPAEIRDYLSQMRDVIAALKD